VGFTSFGNIGCVTGNLLIRNKRLNVIPDLKCSPLIWIQMYFSYLLFDWVWLCPFGYIYLNSSTTHLKDLCPGFHIVWCRPNEIGNIQAGYHQYCVSTTLRPLYRQKRRWSLFSALRGPLVCTVLKVYLSSDRMPNQIRKCSQHYTPKINSNSKFTDLGWTFVYSTTLFFPR